MLPDPHFYPTHTPSVHGPNGGAAFPFCASPDGRIPHEGEQRPAAEFGLFDIGRDPAAVGGTVRITSIRPLGSLTAHPVGALQSASGASIGDHGSSSEGFAHDTDQALRLRFLGRHLAQQLQGGNDGRQQNQHVGREG